MRANVPSKKKKTYYVQDGLRNYLQTHGRETPLPIRYEDLRRFTRSFPLYDLDGNDTYWETVQYEQNELQELVENLTFIYALLKAGGDVEVTQHLTVARIDFCKFGNSNPFRVRIINRLNDNYDHFYVKTADASRIYGLELEDLLSPNRMQFLVDGQTLIEEHVPGVPGDLFIKKYLPALHEFDQIRVAKEFVKFNERCFVRLLGDMRAYNYVVDITPDIEGSQYRIRAIDFDQQSYEGRKSFYLPQYFKENNPIIFLGIQHMSPQTVRQYQLEERTMIAARIMTERERTNELLGIMRADRISSLDKVEQLRAELAEHHLTELFQRCVTMGEVVESNIRLLLKKAFRQSIAS
ncbi:MAG: hypothetical protein AAGN35_14590 [Bacteroidota bacterium]